MAFPEEIKANNVKSFSNVSTQKNDAKREKPSTKVIIRRLPPVIDGETFLNQISPVPSYDYFYLVRGEAALGENSFSRAYINFIHPEDVFDFKEKFDNYVFLDHKGNEYAAVVEFAAFQKIPKKRNKVKMDPKCGSIESDPFYLEFIENLNKPLEQEDKPEYSYQFLTEAKESKELLTTPLLEFVKNRRFERMRIREERREERKRKELERKKNRDEERKRRCEEKSPSKAFSKSNKSEIKLEEKDVSDKDVKEEMLSSKGEKSSEKLNNTFKTKERKFEDRKKDNKKPSPRKEFSDRREFKGRKEYIRESKFETVKKEEKQFPKKVKKYSEKREERKIEAQKAEKKKAEELDSQLPVTKSSPEKGDNSTKKCVDEDINDSSNKDLKNNEFSEDISLLNKEYRIEESLKKLDCKSDESNSRTSEDKEFQIKSTDTKESRRERIRNKDRPTIAIYRPGMLSKRKIAEGDIEKDSSKSTK